MIVTKKKYDVFVDCLKKLTDKDLQEAINEAGEQGYPSYEERLLFVSLVQERGRRIIENEQKQLNPY